MLVVTLVVVAAAAAATTVVVGAAVVAGSGATVVVGSGTRVEEVDEGTTMVVSVSVEVDCGRGNSLFTFAAPATGAVVAATEVVVAAGTEVAAPGVSVMVTVTTVTSTSVTKTRLFSGLAAAPKTHKAPTNNEPFMLIDFWCFDELLVDR